MLNIRNYLFFQFVVKAYSNITQNGLIHQFDWTPYIGTCTAFTLLSFPNLLELDMSSCDNLLPNDIVDCIGFLRDIQVIKFDRCKQFTQYHFMKIFTQISKIKRASMLKCTTLPFTAAYIICSSLPNLHEIDFEPCNIKIEEHDWKRLRAIFFKVQFGENFRSICNM